MIFKKKNFKSRYSIYYIFIKTFKFYEIKILTHEIENRNFNINVKKDFSHIELKIRKENNHFHELFCYHKYLITNYTFLFIFKSNKFIIYTNFLIRFAI